jgi:hypothetical protein
VRSADGALTVMIVCKTVTGSTPVTVTAGSFAGTGTAQVWQLTSVNTITRLSDVDFAASTATLTVPPQSITLVVAPGVSVAPAAPTGLKIRVGS